MPSVHLLLLIQRLNPTGFPITLGLLFSPHQSVPWQLLSVETQLCVLACRIRQLLQGLPPCEQCSLRGEGSGFGLSPWCFSLGPVFRLRLLFWFHPRKDHRPGPVSLSNMLQNRVCLGDWVVIAGKIQGLESSAVWGQNVPFVFYPSVCLVDLLERACRGRRDS